ncbi:hypothetical protein BDFG_06075 [Blastomyces dermatitidis ATCC 26199]|nr:hypothetical protein BDFG_06075 [Blastomyces dermatitidis ATCC 26199]
MDMDMDFHSNNGYTYPPPAPTPAGTVTAHQHPSFIAVRSLRVASARTQPVHTYIHTYIGRQRTKSPYPGIHTSKNALDNCRNPPKRRQRPSIPRSRFYPDRDVHVLEYLKKAA